MADFPHGTLRHRAELAFGADPGTDPGTWTWTDVTNSLQSQSFTITRGRAAAAGAVAPADITFVLDNPNGDFTPDLATGAYYPDVVLGVPGRYSLLGTTTYLALPGAGARITTPHTADLTTADLDIRVDLTLSNWLLVDGNYLDICGKWGPSGQRSWHLDIGATGVPYLIWSTDGADNLLGADPGAVQLPVPGSGRLALRVVLDVNNGSGGWTCTYSTAPAIDGPWTVLATVTDTGPTSIFASTSALEVGDVTNSATPTPPAGRLHGFEMRSGINGTVVAKVTAASETPGAATFADDTGRTWTLAGGAELTRWYPRVTGNVTAWLPTWPYGDLSNEDTGYRGEARTTVTVSGVMQRMGQGSPPLQSTLRRRIPSGDPIAYVPFEDGVATTQAASALPGGAPASLSGATWAADSTLPGSDALPTLGAHSNLSLQVPVPSGAVTGWHVECVFKINTWPTADTPFLRMRFNSGAVREWQINAVAGGSFGFQYVGLDSNGDVFTGGLTGLPKVGVWNRFKMWVEQDGSNVDVTVGWTEISGTGGGSTATYAGTVTAIRQIYCPYGSVGSGLEGMALGHLAVLPEPGTGIFDFADNGFDGELAGHRLIRLCDEEGVPMQLIGDAPSSTPMGPQLIRTLLDLLQECADADGGILGEQRDRPGLKARLRNSLYNQTPVLTLDAERNQITNPFAPTLNDQGLANVATVSRTNGSSATAIDAESVARSGRYDGGSTTLNVATDGQLADIASWLVHQNAWPGMRYGQIPIDLATAPELIDEWLLLDFGDLIAITDLPPQHPTDTVSAMTQGYSETVSPTGWTAQPTCTPGGPWTVGILDDFVLGRGDTNGSTLATAADEDDTQLSVATQSGPLWVTDPAESPFDLRVAGEVVTVVSVGTVLNGNAYFETNVSGWAGAGATIAWNPNRVYPYGGAVASLQITPDGVSASGGANASMVPVTAGQSYTASAWMYCNGGLANACMAVDWYDGSGVYLSTGGLANIIALAPAVWTPFAQTLTAPAGAAQAVLRARHGGTPPSNIPWNIWAARLIPTSTYAASPQTLTVRRSVNGVVKPLPLGADVRLAHPMILAL